MTLPATIPPLHLVEASFNQTEFRRWRAQRGIPEDDWAFHVLLTELFGQGQNLRPYRTLPSRSLLYGYSRRTAAELQADLDFASPAQHGIIPPASLRSRPLPETWQPGRRLGFEIKLCPLKRAYAPAAPGTRRSKPIERDLYAYKLQRKAQGEIVPPRAIVYGQWLQYRMEKQGGARLEQVALVDYYPLTTQRDPNRSPIALPVATMEGVCTVQDPEKFQELLGQGLGRHLAYGYGMLLIKPPANVRPAPPLPPLPAKQTAPGPGAEAESE